MNAEVKFDRSVFDRVIREIGERGRTPREYQWQVAAETLEHALERGSDSVLIESPCGSGKTLMGLLVARYCEVAFGWRTNWVAMRRYLLRQAQAENKFVGLENFQPVSMFDQAIPEAEVTIMDEAQHDATVSAGHVHAQSRARLILGLTATPFRTDRVKLAFRHVVRKAGIHRLIQDGYLAPFRHFVPAGPWTPENVARVYLDDPARWGKSVVFFPRVQEAEEFTRILRNNRVRSLCITGETGEREDLLDRFNDGEWAALSNVGVLTEGFNCETLQTVFVRPSSRTPTIQMGGRALRPMPGKVANIVQGGGARWSFLRTATPLETWVQRSTSDAWVSLGSSAKVEEAAVRGLQALAAAPVKPLPEWLRGRAAIQRRDPRRRSDSEYDMSLSRPREF